ncbi:hypothetical protein Tco_0522618 [Tanacetum coccineum]
MLIFIKSSIFSLAAPLITLCWFYHDLMAPWLQQFWATATLQVINDVPHIRAKVAGKKILVSEATIRADLLFDDENGVDCFPKQVIWDTLRDIGYEGCAKALNSKCCSFSKVPAYLNDPASLLRYASLHWYSYLLEGTAEIQGLLTSKEPTPYKQRRRRPRIRRNVFSQIGENKDGKESLSEETQGSRKKIHPQHFFDDTADKDLPVTHCSKSRRIGLETTQSTANEVNYLTPRPENFEDEAGPSMPTPAKIRKKRVFDELRITKPKTTLRKPTSLLKKKRNQMMSFLKGQGYKNLQKLKYPQMKELYDKVQASIKDSFKDFIPMDSEKEKEMLKERDAQRLSRKRKATITVEQPSKKPN